MFEVDRSDSFTDSRVVKPFSKDVAEEFAAHVGGKVLHIKGYEDALPSGISLDRDRSIIFNVANIPEARERGRGVDIFRQYTRDASGKMRIENKIIGENAFVIFDEGMVTIQWPSTKSGITHASLTFYPPVPPLPSG